MICLTRDRQFAAAAFCVALGLLAVFDGGCGKNSGKSEMITIRANVYELLPPAESKPVKLTGVELV